MTRSVAAPFLATALLLTASLCHGEPAAWQVRSSDGGELWLLGSVHYLRESDYPLPETVDRLYLHSESLVMEIDLDDRNRAWLTTLRELLEEETRYLVVVGALHLVGEESVVD